MRLCEAGPLLRLDCRIAFERDGAVMAKRVPSSKGGKDARTQCMRDALPRKRVEGARSVSRRQPPIAVITIEGDRGGGPHQRNWLQNGVCHERLHVQGALQGTSPCRSICKVQTSAQVCVRKNAHNAPLSR